MCKVRTQVCSYSMDVSTHVLHMHHLLAFFGSVSSANVTRFFAAALPAFAPAPLAGGLSLSAQPAAVTSASEGAFAAQCLSVRRICAVRTVRTPVVTVLVPVQRRRRTQGITVVS